MLSPADLRSVPVLQAILLMGFLYLGSALAGSPPARAEAGSRTASEKRTAEMGSTETTDPWLRRATTVDGEVRADARAVERAVAAFQEAVAKDPDHPGLRARLLQALAFEGQHVVVGEAAQRELFDAARLLAEEGFGRLARRLGGTRALDGLEPEERAEALRGLLAGPGRPETDPAATERASTRDAATGWTVTDLAALHFWGAVVWGQWADRVGSLKAAREGVAGELRTLAGTALELDPGYADAGPHRFLGRLHSEAPRIPFITGWVDRDLAVQHLERAVELAPDEPENALFLAEALLEHRPRRAGEARALLIDLSERQPRPDHLLEDSRTLERARELVRDRIGEP